MSAWGNKDDKTSAGTVTLTAPAITFNGATGHAAGVYNSSGHPFQLGDPVAYSDGGGTQVVGLTDGDTYFVTNVTTDTFMVAATEAHALHNVPTAIVSTARISSSRATIIAGAMPPRVIATTAFHAPSSGPLPSKRHASARFPPKRKGQHQTPE